MYILSMNTCSIKNNIPCQLYFQPPAIKKTKKEKKTWIFKSDSLKNLLDKCTALKQLAVVFPDMVQTVQGHEEVTQLHGGVEGHTFYMHIITLH